MELEAFCIFLHGFGTDACKIRVPSEVNPHVRMVFCAPWALTDMVALPQVYKLRICVLLVRFKASDTLV